MDTTRRFARRTRLALAAATALASAALLTPAASAAITDHAGPASGAKPTVVLVHGAWADGSGWNAVTKRLQRDGYPVVAPANPLRGVANDSAYINSVLKSIEGPIVLVGHSYGGTVITNAAADNPNVKALVYIAAFVPDQGELQGELLGKFPGSEINDAINPVPYTLADGTGGTDLYLKPDKFRPVFAADVSRSDAALMAAAQRPFTAAGFEEPTRTAAWHTIPSYGLVATNDKAIPPALQRWEYERAGFEKVVEAQGASHVPFISQPGSTVNLIKDADRATR
ncbi:alpha/beta hydrolase [Streptomyces sp. NPDC004610]|uniref:alpha/beta fold hydrolase n=1 Tax=unclassified Streptomyces TaxID=2593676 RepID=UPI0033ACCAF9